MGDAAIRVAIFNDWIPFHLGLEEEDIPADDPIKWQEFIAAPHMDVSDYGNEKTYSLNDDRAIQEMHRLLKFETCPICRNKMVIMDFWCAEKLLICLHCGFWGGRGHREAHAFRKSFPARGVFGLYKPIKPLSQETTEYLITHMRRHPKDLPKITPQRAEKFMMELLKDYLKCEVKPLGGSKDKGVDGFIVKGDSIETIIQVKWRQNINKAESVKVVREVAGTLLARGYPTGVLVSNAVRYSPEAKEDAALISSRSLTGLGRMNLQLIDYHNILDMLEISNTRLTANMQVKDWFTFSEIETIFDGAMKLRESYVRTYFNV